MDTQNRTPAPDQRCATERDQATARSARGVADEQAALMTSQTKAQLADLTERAARRSMTITSTPEGWQLASAWRVVVVGDVDAIAAWLSAAETYDRRPRQYFPAGCQADT
ncbi:hypothetical protein ACFVJ5_16565 [Nocardia sp. NPDC127606]|uniref:hypothetical protein n=2 Tax=unclassified Nocardia TaxID=2637762 RepID=UPI0036329E07